MGIVEIVIFTLAVYRVSTDMAWMSGPFHVFEYFRGLIIQKFGIHSWITEGVNCPICLAFWVSTPIIFTHGIIEWLTIAGASAFLSRVSAQEH